MNAKPITNKAVNPWVVLALMAIPIFVGSLDLTVVSAFLPELVLDLQLPLQTGLDDAAWIVSAYLLADAIGLIVMARLSDRIGRRRVYIICMLIFIVGSVIVAVAHEAPTDLVYGILRRMGERPDRAYVNLQVIIFGRVVQALGAGALVPVTLALAADLFPPERRAVPLGFIGAVDTLGWVLGHLYGGLFIQIPGMTWQGLFWVNVPLMLFALALTLWSLRNVQMTYHRTRFDFLGTALIIAALTCLNLGLGANVEIPTTISGLEQLSGPPPYAVPLLLAAAVLFVIFVIVELRVRDPLLDPRIFRNRNIAAGSMANFIIGYCLFIGLVSVPILINIRQQSATDIRSAALDVGILLSTLTVPMALAAIPGGWLSNRIGYRNTTVIGLVLALVGFFTIWRTWYLEISEVTIALQMLLIGTGIGLTFSPISTSVINAAQPSERGLASALVAVLRLLGMTICVSSLTTFAVQRVNFLAASRLPTNNLNPAEYPMIYAESTVTILAELGLIGAVLCGAALIPALLLRNRLVNPPETAQTTLTEKSTATSGD